MKIRSLLIAAVLIIIGYGLYRFGVSQGAPMPVEPTKPSVTAQGIVAEKKPLYWHDPMNPTQRFDKPGKSPYMDMELVPVYASEKDNNVSIDSRVQQNLGVRTAVVIQGKLESNLTAVGSVA